jgi:toxin-antitoxin system PIN domain toxin
MTVFLLDVNVLIALFWPDHESHERVLRWFVRNAIRGWATCPLTQAAFVRISSNPAFSAHAVSPPEALRLLRTNLKHPGHRFWRDEIGFGEAVDRFEERLVGHRQITDAYLLGLALFNKGKLVTLDESVMTLLPEGSPHRSGVEIIRELS